MASANVRLGNKSAAWFTANAAHVLKDGQQVYLNDDSGDFKKGDGIRTIAQLTWITNGAGAGQVDSVVGTANRISVNDTDPANPIVNIDTAYDALKANAVTRLISGGAITIGTYGGSGSNDDIRVAASVYYLEGETANRTAVQTDFLDIALSTSGTQRFIGLYGTASNTITKVEGTSAPYASFPTQPANTALIGYVLVGDASMGTTPDLSGYLLKSDKATASDVITGTDDTKYVTSLALKNAGPIITTVASSAAPAFITSLNPETTDQLIVTGLAVNTIIPAPSVAIVQGKKYIVRVKDNGVARTVGFNPAYRFSSDLPNPGITTISKTSYYGGIGNSTDNKIDIVAILNNL
jgi:hypothetical protein